VKKFGCCFGCFGAPFLFCKLSLLHFLYNPTDKRLIWSLQDSSPLFVSLIAVSKIRSGHSLIWFEALGRLAIGFEAASAVEKGVEMEQTVRQISLILGCIIPK
jgi:hypothetical protein